MPLCLAVLARVRFSASEQSIRLSRPHSERLREWETANQQALCRGGECSSSTSFATSIFLQAFAPSRDRLNGSIPPRFRLPRRLLHASSGETTAAVRVCLCEH